MTSSIKSEIARIEAEERELNLKVNGAHGSIPRAEWLAMADVELAKIRALRAAKASLLASA